VRVLERASTAFVGTVRRTPHLLRVRPDDPKFPREIVVPFAEGKEAKEGQKVVVEITEWGGTGSTSVGRITEVLGMPGDPGLDVLIIVKHHGLPTSFPPEVDAAAAALPDEIPSDEISRREDLRDRQIITIDPVTAKDFDDALSLEPLGEKELELGVHIADVSHYVRFGETLDEEAWRRGSSVYLVDRVLPMLPEKLSNHLCSLNPDVDRLAMSVLMRITPHGKVLDYRIVDSVIRSKRRFAYEDVQAHFDGTSDVRKESRELAALVDRLRRLASALHAKRVKRGALDFDLPTSRVELDEQGLPIDIQKVVRLESHRLVEEFMLLANETVAHHIKKAKLPTLFRAHEDPSEKKLEELQVILGRFGYSLYVDDQGRVPPRQLQRVLAATAGKPEETIVNTLVLRSLARARYDEHPLGHYGLALKDYTHFTSPIRRYPDLVVHRTLRILSGRQKRPLSDLVRYREWVADTAIHSSDRERIAEGAERDSIELKKIQFMERHVGEVFGGIVTGVNSFGFFVELEDFHVSGLVHINNLSDDFYEYLEEEFALLGSSTGRRFTLGDRVRVQVLSVSKELRQIDFLLDAMPAGEDEEESPSRRRRRAKTVFEGKGSRKKKAREATQEVGRTKRGGRKRRKR